MIIKTNLNIGKSLGNSRIDGTPMVECVGEELLRIDPNDYEIINEMTDNLRYDNYNPRTLEYVQARNINSWVCKDCGGIFKSDDPSKVNCTC